jgi:hypothetical protein
MTRHLFAAASLALFVVPLSLRAANQLHAETDNRSSVVWTNDDLEKLHAFDLISIVGQTPKQVSDPESVPATEPYRKTKDPDWYAVRAAQFQDELEFRETQLHDFLQALDDVRSLKNTTPGVNLDENGMAITPSDAIEVLQRRVTETQSKFEALEDLARRNGIPPGATRPVNSAPAV